MNAYWLEHEDVQLTGKRRQRTMDKYLAWIIYLFGVLGGDAMVAVYFALVSGWDGAPGIVGAFFCTAIGVIPTLASTRGRDSTFRALNMVLAFALFVCCVYAGITAFKLVRAERQHDAATQRALQRGDKVREAVSEARKQGMRSRDAAEVGRAVSAVVATESQTSQESREALKEPHWFPYFPWVVGAIISALSVVLLIPYRASEDRNRDGIPDYLQSKKAKTDPAADPKDLPRPQP